MPLTTTQQTIDYLKEHPYIKSCLRKGIINYSALARLIAREIQIGKKTSIEAILVACRRYQKKLNEQFDQDHNIKSILNNSEIEIKNKVIVHILEKGISFTILQELEKVTKTENSIFYLLEGSNTYTLITQEKMENEVKKKTGNQIIKTNKNLALVMFKSPKKIEDTPGIMAYLTTLFQENNVNILELVSCWTDTLFVISAQDVQKTISFLKF